MQPLDGGDLSIGDAGAGEPAGRSIDGRRHLEHSRTSLSVKRRTRRIARSSPSAARTLRASRKGVRETLDLGAQLAFGTRAPAETALDYCVRNCTKTSS